MKKVSNEARLVIIDGKEALEIELTQGQVAFIDVEDWERIKIHRWHALKGQETFNAARNFQSGGSIRKQYMHQCIMGSGDGDEVDHIRHPGTDNRRSNLRFCDQSRNQQNTKARGGSSKFKGVSWIESKQRWRVTFRHEKRAYFLGNFMSEDEAALAYDSWIRKHGCGFTRLNFVYTRPVPIWPAA